jgi:hypothetical protein
MRRSCGHRGAPISILRQKRSGPRSAAGDVGQGDRGRSSHGRCYVGTASPLTAVSRRDLRLATRSLSVGRSCPTSAPKAQTGPRTAHAVGPPVHTVPDIKYWIGAFCPYIRSRPSHDVTDSRSSRRAADRVLAAVSCAPIAGRSTMFRRCGGPAYVRSPGRVVCGRRQNAGTASRLKAAATARWLREGGVA